MGLRSQRNTLQLAKMQFSTMRVLLNLNVYSTACLGGGLRSSNASSFEQAVRVATRYAPAPLLPWAPIRLARRRADAT